MLKEIVGSQILIAITDEECLQALLALEAHALQTLHNRHLLLRELHLHRSWRQTCASHTHLLVLGLELAAMRIVWATITGRCQVVSHV